MVILNDLLQNHSVALFGWVIFHDPGQSRNTICAGYSYQNQWYNRSLKSEREVVGSSLQSSLQFCQKIKKRKKMERGMGDFLLSPSKAKATWQNQTESGAGGQRITWTFFWDMDRCSGLWNWWWCTWTRRLLLSSRQLVKLMPVLSRTCMVSRPLEEPAAASRPPVLRSHLFFVRRHRVWFRQPKPCSRMDPVCNCTKQTRRIENTCWIVCLTTQIFVQEFGGHILQESHFITSLEYAWQA